MNFEELKDSELQEKAKACKTPEELLALVKEEGVDLTDEDLKGISGGGSWDWDDDCSSYDCIHGGKA